MASVFSMIVAGEIPCYKVAENDKFLAFLDINPVMPGHTLVIPKREVSYIFDMPDEEYVEFELFAKKVALGLKKAIHLIPINNEGDMNFRNKQSLSGEEMSSIAARIASEIK